MGDDSARTDSGLFDGLYELSVWDTVPTFRSRKSSFLNHPVTGADESSTRSPSTKNEAGPSAFPAYLTYLSCKPSPHPQPSPTTFHPLYSLLRSIGILMGVSLMIYSTRVHFAPAFRKHGKAVPEQRLPPMIVGAVILPIGLLWFAWTSSPVIVWVPQVMSSALIGCGMLVTFWQGM